MTNFQITKNGKILVDGLTEQEAKDKLFTTVEDFSSGYIYDNENETIYHEVDGRIVAKKGDGSVIAGDDYFEILSN